MTKRRTKHALLMSGLALLLCVSMLIGSTYAWFTDSVTSTGNIIKSGTLDVEMYWADGKDDPAADTTVWTDASAGAMFTNDLWEPGYTEVRHLRIANTGSLALKYQLSVIPTGIVSELANVIDVYLLDPAQKVSDRSDLSAITPDGTLADILADMPANANGELIANETVTVTFVLKMNENAGNDYQNKEIGTDFTVQLLATQLTYEKDSFDDQYDVESIYPIVTEGTYNGGDTIVADKVSVTLPDSAEEGVYSLRVDSESKNTDADGKTTLSLNIDLLKDGVKVVSNPGTVYTVKINVGKNLDVTELKHNGAPIVGFDYSMDVGIVTFTTESFSPFAVVYKAYAAKIGDALYYSIDEAVTNWTNGKTLTLMSDVTLSDVIKLSSTEYHILDLATYTMTAAKSKDAIQIVNNGRSSASYALDIKADAANPGGITANGKAIVRTAGKSGVKDRPIIRFYNGVFNGSNIVYHSGSNGTNCPQFQFHGGEFNGTIYSNRTLNQFYGGTFNGSLMMSVDSSAYALISGGTFKQLSNLYMSALNIGKFTIGSAKGVYDREVYVNDDGYYVVSKTKPADIEASVVKAPGTNDYLKYSKVATEGELNYTDVYTALKNNKSAKVTVYVSELDLAGISFTGTIVVPEGSTLTIANAPADLKVEGDVSYS